MAGEAANFYAHSLEGAPSSEWQTLEDHLTETADLATIFASKIDLASLGKMEGLLHDIGKYSRAFQDYLNSTEGKNDPDAETVNAKGLRGKVDHSTAGAQMVWEILNGGNGPSRLLAQVIALCVASHHSGLIDCIGPDGDDKFSVRMSKGDEQTHLEEVRRAADRDLLKSVNATVHSTDCNTEFTSQLQRLLSNEDSREVREFYVGLLVRFLFSALIDADRLSSAGRYKEGFSNQSDGTEWASLIRRLEHHIFGLKQRNWVDQIRAKVSLSCRDFASRDKGLYKLTVPTGGGKTLASLRFGLHHAARHKMDRVIYVIPYTSIIDQNAAVARSVLEESSNGPRQLVVLEHHSNLTPDKETWQTQLLSENWNARIIFTTTVQFLEALFGGGTRGVRRMHRLANAVVIFDEVQTIPIKTVHLFNNAINFLVRECGSTVVLCTATQPLLDAVDKDKGAARLSERPEMAPKDTDIDQALQRVKVFDGRKGGGWEEGEIAQLVCKEARQTGSALAIVNTKPAARALYVLCRKEMTSVIHLSTNMCPAHRLKTIDEIKKRLDTEHAPSEPLVCISTQLVEAGVDLDFGSVVRYLAGLDSVAQAAGRCNRNGRRTSGNVILVNPSHESLANLPEIDKGKQVTERILDEYRKDSKAFDDNILGPRAMRHYYEYYFFQRAHDMTYPVPAKVLGHDDDLLSLLSTNDLSVEAYKHSQKLAPPFALRQSFETAGQVFEVIEAAGEGVIVPWGEGKVLINELCAITTNIERTKQLLRQAQRYSVNLYPHIREKLDKLGGLHEIQKGSGVLWIDERFYNEYIGVLSDDENIIMDFLSA